MFKNNRKKYAKRRLKGVQVSIWDLEFKIYKNRAIREEVRQKYDSDTSKISSIKEKIKEEKDTAERAKLDDIIVVLDGAVSTLDGNVLILE